MTLQINKSALIHFAEVVEEQPTDLVALERISELTTAIGFKCRLASAVQTWKQQLTVEGPPSTLSPLEVQIDTPWGEQQVELEPRLHPSTKVHEALNAFHHIVEMLDRCRELHAPDPQLVDRARELERVLLGESLRFARSGTFDWPMERFQVRLEWGNHFELVTIMGPRTAILADAFVSDPTSPGIPLRDVAMAVLKLLTGRILERSAFLATNNCVRDEARRAAAALKELAETYEQGESDGTRN